MHFSGPVSSDSAVLQSLGSGYGAKLFAGGFFRDHNVVLHRRAEGICAGLGGNRD